MSARTKAVTVPAVLHTTPEHTWNRIEVDAGDEWAHVEFEVDSVTINPLSTGEILLSFKHRATLTVAGNVPRAAALSTAATTAPVRHLCRQTPDLYCLPCADKFVAQVQWHYDRCLSTPAAFDLVTYERASGWLEYFRSSPKIDEELAARARKAAALSEEEFKESIDKTVAKVVAETEHSGTSPKKGRGKSQDSIDLIGAMYVVAEKARPITGRGIGYKLFVAGLIPSMSVADMKVVYRLLKDARDASIIPWRWIVDETREIARVPRWDDPAEFAAAASAQYRKDFWTQQPHRIQVWSEKGTISGVIDPVLQKYGIDFLAVGGFGSYSKVREAAEDNDGRPLIILYVGDRDPSGMCMSQQDLPARFVKFGGTHVVLRRIALTPEQCEGLPSFPASDKVKDTRYRGFVAKYGDQCWELDAMDPNDLRDLVELEIVKLIEPTAWARCEVVNKAEQESLRMVLNGWVATESEAAS